MTKQEEKKVLDLRTIGKGYKAIATELNLPVSTVKSFCHRSGISNNKCRNCGKILEHTPGKKKKKFCSEVCRIKWWNVNRKTMKHPLIKPKLCEYCGKSFYPAKRAAQKFCCRDCYLKAVRKEA